MNLAAVLKQWRWASKLTLRDAAKQIGVSHTTLLRIENGQAADSKNLSAVLRWLLS